MAVSEEEDMSEDGPHEAPTPEELVEVERSVTVAADPDEVWRHVVDGTVASEWMESPIGIEPRPGGRIDFSPDSVDFLGVVEEVEPGRSITWSWRHPDRDPSQVTITLEGVEEGTRVIVTERLIPYQVTDTRLPQWGREPGQLLAA
jgi:uncharacterized protein YndB with AHSA1/START domain